MQSLPLYISRDERADWLITLEFGRVLDGPGGDIVGFTVKDSAASTPPSTTSCGAARASTPRCSASTTNRCYFSLAINAEDREEEAYLWRTCRECGDSMAHHGLGYTLLDLGEREEARDAFVRALALEAAGGMETDAEDLLKTLERST